MNMQKQKPIWSKILAMLCALALCISMVPAASAAPGGDSSTTNSNVTELTVTKGDGIVGFATYSTDIGNHIVTDGSVNYQMVDNKLKVTSASNGPLPLAITFYAQADYQPTITSSNDGVSAIASDYGDDWWMITISLANATDSEVTLNAEAVPTYTVTLNETTEGEKGYNLIEGSSDTVKQGESYQFYVIPKTGYQTPEVTVTRGVSDTGSNPETIFPSEDGTGLYTVENIQSDITITIGKAQPQPYTVNFISGAGYSFEGANDTTIAADGTATVNYKSSVSFKVKLNDDYDNSNVIVYANGSKLTAVNNVYTINNITVDQTVSVVGVEKNKYTVTLPTNTNSYYITTVDPTVVEPGGQFTFYVVVNPGYDADNVKVTVDNNQTVTKTGVNSYTIINITDDTSISISGIEAAQYNVTTNGGDHATFTIRGLPEDNKVGYGTQTFTVTPDAGYKVDSVKVNDTSVTADSDGKYTIFVSNDVNIVVTTSPVVNVTLTTTVTATGDTRYTIVVKTFPGEVTGNSTGISVVGYGTLYSNESFDSQSLKDVILDLSLNDTLTQQTVLNAPVVYSYGMKTKFPLYELRNTFSYTFNNSSSTNRFGAGWIKLSDGQNSWIVFSDTAQCQYNP